MLMIPEIEKTEVKFEENVILLDVSYTDKVTGEMIAYFSKIIDRTLPNADFSLFLEALSLDAGLRPEEGKEVSDRTIQTLLIYDRQSGKLENIIPQDVEKSLDNVAFKSKLGEFTLNAFCPQDMVTREELFMESLQLLLNAEEVKHLIIVGDEQAYGARIYEELKKYNLEDRAVVFGMEPPKKEQSIDWEILGFAVLHSIGIKSEELQ